MQIVLVHGGWQGGWAWDAVAAELTAAGHDVFAPTLRGLESGDVDRSGITAVDMGEDLVRQIDEHGFDRFTLVGHSGGGPMIQFVADRHPERTERVVFVDAWVLHTGECVNDALPAELGAAVGALAEQSADQSAALPAELWSAAFMQDADEQTLAATLPRLVPSPLGWFTCPVNLDRFWANQPPASYVFLRQDQAVPPEYYQLAATRLTDPRIVECDGSHEVMLTHPEKLAAALRTAIE